MDIEGFVVMSETKVSALKEVISKIKNSFTIGVGSNEEIEYDNGGALLEELTFSVITNQEIRTLKKFFGREFGHTQFTCLLDPDFTEGLLEEDD
jgi:hypothetical protein